MSAESPHFRTAAHGDETGLTKGASLGRYVVLGLLGLIERRYLPRPAGAGRGEPEARS